MSTQGLPAAIPSVVRASACPSTEVDTTVGYPSTRLLVSVRGVEEVETALRAGVEWIDIKEPAAGALGAADPATIAAIVKRVGVRANISVALGELRDFTSRPKLPRAISFAKLGLAGCAAQPDWPRRWEAVLRSLPAKVTPVAVAYADWRYAQAPSPLDVIEHGARIGCGAALLDTYGKQAGGLFDHCGENQVRDWIAEARRHGMLTVLAGSLALEMIERAARLQPDLVAVRGAACDDGRSGQVSETRIAELQVRLRHAQHLQAKP